MRGFWQELAECLSIHVEHDYGIDGFGLLSHVQCQHTVADRTCAGLEFFLGPGEIEVEHTDEQDRLGRSNCAQNNTRLWIQHNAYLVR